MTDGCGCKLCRNGKAGTVNDLAIDGLTIPQIREWIATNLSFSVTDALLKRHFEAFETPVYGGELRREPVTEDERYTSIAIDAKEALAALDLGDLFSEPSNPNLVIDKLQSLHVSIHFKQALLLNHYLDLVLAGEVPAVPKELYQNTTRTFELMCKSTGINYVINQGAALDAIARMGYTLSKTPIESD